MTAACRGPRCWLRQKQRSCDVCIASLGMGNWRRWGLERTAAGKVGVSRSICLPHLRIFLSMISSWAGVGGINWLVYVSRGIRALRST